MIYDTFKYFFTSLFVQIDLCSRPHIKYIVTFRYNKNVKSMKQFK